MATLDSLPGDQRAVLQLVLGRGRSYDQIARLLSINPTGVRERALTALDALGPQTRLEADARAQIADYLLGQLPEAELDPVRDRLAQSPADRAWARVVSSELAPLASGPLPEIPLETSAERAAAAPAPPPAPPQPAPPLPEPADSAEPRVESPAPPETPDAPASEAASAQEGRRGRRARRRREREVATEPAAAAAEPAAAEPVADGAGDGAATPRSSRIGGLVVIAVTVLIVAVVVVVIVALGGKSGHKKAATSSTVASAPPTTTTTTASTPTSTGTTTSATPVAQINLTAPSGSANTKAAGLAQVLKQGGAFGIALVAQHMTPNTTEPANAYAVWLYNSPTDAHILGFVNPGVGSSGQLSTAGPLPSNATHYKELVVTVETTGTPKQPGTIVLEGPFSEGH